MKKWLFLVMIVFVVSGCELPQNASIKVTDKDKVLAEQSIAIEEEVPIALEEEKIGVESKEIKVEAIVLAKEEVAIIRTSDEIIAQNRWGFSIYDPETGVAEYYASKGSYLGKKSIY
ncbi:hypothetical protein ACFL2J_04135 [Candidatus Omnitrophota bacterium]